MNVTPQTTAQRDGTLSARTNSVILGRQDVASVVLRLIGMELYKIRRRAMSKILSIIGIAATIIVFLLLSIGTIFFLNAPPESFEPVNCTQTVGSSGPPQGGQTQNCQRQQLTPQEIAQARQQAIRGASEPLRLPGSLNIAVTIALTPFTVLIIILVGAIAGGEFSIGTVRLLFTRGPTRTQFLLAKYGAAIACTGIGILAMSTIGVLAGQALNPISGIAQNFDFFSAGWLGHAALYLLAAMLNWFLYSAIAIFFGTLGRSTVAGIVGALTWFFVEPIVGGALNLAGTFIRGPFGDFLKAVPDYLIGNNIGALLQNQGQYIFGGTASSLSDLRALLVLAVYLALFIGLAWWLNERRDVTN